MRVHLEDFIAVPAADLAGARGIADGIFAKLGVRLEWKEGEPHPPDAISARPEEATAPLEIEFDESPPGRVPRNAMAYAVPGRTGVCIHVFYSRVKNATSRGRAPVMLGHVLAHEIGHVLQGTARHSADGLMKAHWSSDDYMRMATNSLQFADEDIRLLRARFSRILTGVADRDGPRHLHGMILSGVAPGSPRRWTHSGLKLSLRRRRMKKDAFSPMWLLAVGYVLPEGASRASLLTAAAFLAGWLLMGTPVFPQL